MAIRNPFRRPALAKMFDACVAVASDNFEEFYIVPRKERWHGPNAPRRGASHRHAFWNGWNGAKLNWDSYSKQSLSYAAYRAGEALRLNEEKKS